MNKLTERLRSNLLLLMFIVSSMVLFNLAQIWLNGWWYFVDMAAVMLLMTACIRFWRIPLNELGLTKANIKRGLIFGLVAVVGIVILLATGYLISPHSFLDSRYNVGLLKAATLMLLVIPFRIVVFEEFMFRGMLLTSLKKIFKLRWAIVLSSLAFGLWHIVPALGLAASSQVLHKTAAGLINPVFIAITVSVVATSLAGAVFSWLRLESKSLLAPILAHWSINSLSVGLVVAAYLKLGLH